MASALNHNGASGLRVLLVEDEALIAMMAADMLEGLDAAEVETVATVAEAHAALQARSFDLAILDVKLGAESGVAVAEAARARGVSYFFTTGYGSDALTGEHAAAPVLPKPYTLSDLDGAIRAALASAR